MPISRKPPPSLEGDDTSPQGGSSRDASLNENTRAAFTLTDDAVKPSSSYGELAYDQIDEAVTLMQQRFPDDTSVTRPALPAPPRASMPTPATRNAAPPLSIPETPYRNRFASPQHTPYDQDAYYQHGAAESDPFGYTQPAPVVPRLPAIDSGVPMQWDLGDGHDASDPFIEHPPRMYSEPDPFLDHSAPPAASDPFIEHAPPPPRMYSEPDPFLDRSSLPPDGMEPLDPFQYDPERYAGYVPPAASRSPSPGQNAEYYLIEDEKDAPGYVERQDESGYDNGPEKILTPVEPPMDTKHFGPAPAGRVLRRHKTKKRVPLTEGNLVTHIDVPTQLVLPRKGEPEMMQTRCVCIGLFGHTVL